MQVSWALSEAPSTIHTSAYTSLYARVLLSLANTGPP